MLLQFKKDIDESHKVQLFDPIVAFSDIADVYAALSFLILSSAVDHSRNCVAVSSMLLREGKAFFFSPLSPARTPEDWSLQENSLFSLWLEICECSVNNVQDAGFVNTLDFWASSCSWMRFIPATIVESLFGGITELK